MRQYGPFLVRTIQHVIAGMVGRRLMYRELVDA